MKFKCGHIYNPGNGAKCCRPCLWKLEKDGLLECETCAISNCSSPCSDAPTTSYSYTNQPSTSTSMSQLDGASSRILYCEQCLAYIAENIKYKCGHDYNARAKLCQPCLIKQEEEKAVSCVKCGSQKEHQASEDFQEHVSNREKTAKSVDSPTSTQTQLSSFIYSFIVFEI